MVNPYNDPLKTYGLQIPKVITAQQATHFRPKGRQLKPEEIVDPDVWRKQKWFKTYDEMVQWKSQNGIANAKMVRMKKPYRGYRFQLHYNDKNVTNKSRGIAQ